MDPILVDTIKYVVGDEEADVREFSLARLKGGVSSLDAWAWRSLG